MDENAGAGDPNTKRFKKPIPRIFLIVPGLICLTASAPCDADNERSGSIIKNNIYDYPLTRVAEPVGFRPEPPGYQAIPLGFREKPIGYRDIPLNYSNKILTDIGLPRGYSPNPPNYIENENHPLTDKNPSNQLSPETIRQANNDPDKRISVDNHPLANKNIGQG